jgi:hypothetical protein
LSYTASQPIQPTEQHQAYYRSQTPEWNNRRKELEYNLMLIQNGVSHDSFEDIRAIIQKIVQDASDLSQGNLVELQV